MVVSTSMVLEGMKLGEGRVVNLGGIREKSEYGNEDDQNIFISCIY